MTTTGNPSSAAARPPRRRVPPRAGRRRGFRRRRAAREFPRVRATRRRALECADTTPRAPSRSMPSSDGTSRRDAAATRRARPRVPRARAARLRVGERCDPGVASVGGMPSASITAASTGFSASRRPAHGERHLIGGRRDGRHEEHEHRVDPAVREQDRQRRLVRRGVAEPSMSTGFATLASAGQELAQARDGLRRRASGARAPRRRRRRPRGSRDRPRSSARRRAAPAGAAGSRAALRRRRAPPACRRGSRRPGGRARRPPPRSLRAPPCASRAAFAPADVRPLFSARIGFGATTRRAMRANFRGFPNDSR